MAKLHLEIITQEKKLLSETVDQISAPAVMGEVTILPGHIPLFTKLEDGILKIKRQGKLEEMAVLGGFMDVSPGNHVTILAETAISAESASEAKAEAARQKAQDVMHQKTNEVEFKQAELSLRKAILELKIARRRRQETPQG
jgi:F-type H+-transporting ATPase subunit epsilon